MTEPARPEPAWPVPALPARVLAPAKINLGLFVGPVRETDGRHELVSVMQSISLADELTLKAIEPGAERPGDGRPGAERPGDEDEILCPGVPGDPRENLAARALRSFREETGWRDGPVRLQIAKRIPVAAGLGGGSADAAAALRLAVHASGIGSRRGAAEVRELLLALATRLGADVPAQISPGRWLARGAGERLAPLAAPGRSFGVLLLPIAAELSSAEVYARADILAGKGGRARLRTRAELEEIARELGRSYELGAVVPRADGLLDNDLQAAAISLCAQIEPALAQAREAGADVAFVSGSGPTVVGLFTRANGPERARRAAEDLGGRSPAPICAEPVDERRARALDIPVRHNHDR
jgi:4-diphosphocytidyl-2-C-methyl-D-erythritol kinase